MKYIVILIMLTISTLAGYAQHSKHGGLYSTIQALAYNTDNVIGGAPHVSFGYTENGFGLGPGIGLILLGTDKPYLPLYVNFIYAGGKNKLSPMVNFHIGKGFYKGWGTFIGEDSYVKAGFYANAVGGLAVRFKKSKVHLFGGVTLMSFSSPGVYNDNNSFHESMFTAGIGFFTTN